MGIVLWGLFVSPMSGGGRPERARPLVGSGDRCDGPAQVRNRRMDDAPALVETHSPAFRVPRGVAIQLPDAVGKCGNGQRSGRAASGIGHEVSGQSGELGRAGRARTPRDIIAPPQQGQMSSERPVSRR